MSFLGLWCADASARRAPGRGGPAGKAVCLSFCGEDEGGAEDIDRLYIEVDHVDVVHIGQMDWPGSRWVPLECG